MEKLGTLGRVPDIYTNIYHQYNPIYGLYTGCIGQDGVIFREQLLGYPAKGTQHFPLRIWIFCKLNIRSERHFFVCLSAMASSLTWEIIEQHIQWTILMVISFPVVKILLKEWDFQHLAASHPPQQVWKVSNSMESLGELTLNGKLLQDLYTNDWSHLFQNE